MNCQLGDQAEHKRARILAKAISAEGYGTAGNSIKMLTDWWLGSGYSHWKGPQTSIVHSGR